MKTIIIGLIGDNRCGKDTFAEILIEKYDFRKYAFADCIKDVARLLFGFSENQLYGNEKEIIDSNYGISPREFFQIFGTEFMQLDIYNHLPNLEQKIPKRCFWSQRTVEDIKQYIFNTTDKDRRVVISDIRFLHEVETLQRFITENNNKNNNNIELHLIKISRNKQPINTTDVNNTHQSRTSIQNIPNSLIQYHIVNDTTLENYQIKCKDIVDSLI